MLRLTIAPPGTRWDAARRPIPTSLFDNNIAIAIIPAIASRWIGTCFFKAACIAATARTGVNV
jgi:hypothetical protein